MAPCHSSGCALSFLSQHSSYCEYRSRIFLLLMKVLVLVEPILKLKNSSVPTRLNLFTTVCCSYSCELLTRLAAPPLRRAPGLTWSESRVTRSPSLAMPSSFSSLRCGHRAMQKALATFSVSRLWSAGSLRPMDWSSLWRKNT